MSVGKRGPLAVLTFDTWIEEGFGWTRVATTSHGASRPRTRKKKLCVNISAPPGFHDSKLQYALELAIFLNYHTVEPRHVVSRRRITRSARVLLDTRASNTGTDKSSHLPTITTANDRAKLFPAIVISPVQVTTLTPKKSGHCVSWKLKQNAMTCKSHKPAGYSQ